MPKGGVVFNNVPDLSPYKLLTTQMLSDNFDRMLDADVSQPPSRDHNRFPTRDTSL